MTNKKVWILIVGMFIIMTAIGCAKKKVEQDPRFSTPQKTYDFWLETALKGDVVTSSLCITEESKKVMDLQAKNRDVFIERLTTQAKLFKEYTITDTKIKEDRAVILLNGPKGDALVVPFKREADGWKVDLIGMFR